ncbi:hypothetical protein FA95DRAFT_1678990 [Auriscalpium vulgare]|uniref:Uncharacterized protein n=1 Tax=Auriscalpium vulgare TaxID=40419 RepID=A0ACB8RUK1_9AGAM|nr:hypothetical protein FA95DRAFT_1678990 [Auriscalpium vulgare]
MASNTAYSLRTCALPLVPALFNGVAVTEPRQQAYDRARALEVLGAWWPSATDDWTQPTFAPEVAGRVLGRFLCARALEVLGAWWPSATDDWTQPTFTPEVAGRVLGRFLCEAPGEEFVDIVAEEINRCVREDDAETQRCLASLASFYVDIVLNTFYEYSDEDREYEDDYEEKKVGPFDVVQKAALIREDNRCILTRELDHNEHWRRGLTHETLPTRTRACHIIPHKLVSGHITARSMVRAILQPSGGLASKQVEGQQMNDLRNVMTLGVLADEIFTCMELWLTPVEGRSNTYRVDSSRQDLLKKLPENPVTFTSADLKELPLPDPLLLSFHRACVRILHLSGAGPHLAGLMIAKDLQATIVEDSAALALRKDAAGSALRDKERNSAPPPLSEYFP